VLLRDERQMAVNAVERLCFESADRYATASEKIDDADLAVRFAELAQERQALAAELASHIRALDDLPQQPDPDRETLDDVLSGIKAFLAGDTHATLLAEREQDEDALMAAARAALQQDLPADTLALLQRIATHAESTKEALAGAHR